MYKAVHSSQLPGQAGTGTVHSSSNLQSPVSSLQSEPGFTLLELTIVMFLATLILGLTTLFFTNTLPSAKLGATGREMSAAMRRIKMFAQNRGEDQALIINLDSRQYGQEGGKMKSLPAEMSIRIDDPVSGEIRTGTYPILFHAVGGAEGGTVVLWHKKRAIYIHTDPVMGSVMIRQ